MAHPKLLYLFSPNAPMGSQLFSLGDGSDGVFNPGANTTIDGIKQYTSFHIASGITVTQTANTGVLIIMVQGDATIAGALNLNGKGYGEPGSFEFAWGSGLGRGWHDGGGPAYGNVDLMPIYLGSAGANGGGAGWGNGGAGGGAVILVARKITVTGSITANGSTGGGSSGGGAGGSIWLVALEMSLGTDLLTATGAAGLTGALYGGGGAGHGAPGGAPTNGGGGAGAIGRIRLDYKSLTGSTNPAAHEHPGVILGYLKQFAASAGLGM